MNNINTEQSKDLDECVNGVSGIALMRMYKKRLTFNMLPIDQRIGLLKRHISDAESFKRKESN